MTERQSAVALGADCIDVFGERVRPTHTGGQRNAPASAGMPMLMTRHAGVNAIVTTHAVRPRFAAVKPASTHGGRRVNNARLLR